MTQIKAAFHYEIQICRGGEWRCWIGFTESAMAESVKATWGLFKGTGRQRARLALVGTGRAKVIDRKSARRDA